MDFFSFERAALRLKESVGVQTDKDLAGLLAMDVSAYNKRKTRGSFPEKELRALARQRPELGIDVDYVLSGHSQPPLHERLDTALATAGLPTAEAAAKALGVSLKDMRAMLAGKQPLAEALHEPMRKLGVDVRYVLEGDGGDRSQADHALNPAEAKLLRDYRASSVDVQAVICAAAAAGAANDDLSPPRQKE